LSAGAGSAVSLGWAVSADGDEVDIAPKRVCSPEEACAPVQVGQKQKTVKEIDKQTAVGSWKVSILIVGTKNYCG
jgi:hypothetical protein